AELQTGATMTRHRRATKPIYAEPPAPAAAVQLEVIRTMDDFTDPPTLTDAAPGPASFVPFESAESSPSPAPAPAVTGRQFAGFMAMVVGMFMAILDIQIVSSSIREIQAGLSASADEITWVQTAYLIAEVIMIPFSGYLSRLLST